MTYDNPNDLRVGDEVEVSSVPDIVWTVERLAPSGWAEDVVQLTCGGGVNYHISYTWTPTSGTRWRRRVAPVAKRYGASCRRCKSYFDFAEDRPGFVCFGCGMDGYGKTWGLK